MDLNLEVFTEDSHIRIFIILNALHIYFRPEIAKQFEHPQRFLGLRLHPSPPPHILRIRERERESGRIAPASFTRRLSSPSGGRDYLSGMRTERAFLSDGGRGRRRRHWRRTTRPSGMGSRRLTDLCPFQVRPPLWRSPLLLGRYRIYLLLTLCFWGRGALAPRRFLCSCTNNNPFSGRLRAFQRRPTISRCPNAFDFSIS